MSERRTGSERRDQAEPELYTAHDLARERDIWERAAREDRLNVELGAIRGRLDGIPDVVKTISRQVVLEVLTEQRKNDSEQLEKTATIRRTDVRFLIGVIIGLVVLVVPFEQALIHKLFP